MITLTGHDNIIQVHKDGQEIGVVTITDTPETLQPHVEWNSFATPRGIYEGFLTVITRLRMIKTVLILSAERYAPFFDAFAKRGAVRKVGFLTDIFCENMMQQVHIYQAKKR